MQQLLNELVLLSPSWRPENQSDGPSALRLEMDVSRLRAYDERIVMADISRVQQLTGWVPQPDMPRLLRMLLDYWRHETAFRYPEELSSPRPASSDDRTEFMAEL